MREIKFRGFSIGKKKWVYGNYNYTFERGIIRTIRNIIS